MGKIVAIGGGCYAEHEIDNILQHIMELSGKKRPSVLFLPTASFDMWCETDDEICAFRNLGAIVEPLCVTDKTLTEEQLREKILSADIIYAGGGNLRFLMDAWKKAHVDTFMREAYDKGIVLSGYSSGAMCWFERGYDDCGEDRAFIFVDAVGILPFCNCPHFENESWHKFSTRVREQPLSGIACDNGAAICFINGKVYAMHGNDGGEVWYYDAEKNYMELLFPMDR